MRYKNDAPLEPMALMSPGHRGHQGHVHGIYIPENVKNTRTHTHTKKHKKKNTKTKTHKKKHTHKNTHKKKLRLSITDV